MKVTTLILHGQYSHGFIIILIIRLYLGLAWALADFFCTRMCMLSRLFSLVSLRLSFSFR